jgi:Tfp pilus assembly ATPase PilU
MSAEKSVKVNIPSKPFRLELPDVKTGGCSLLMVGSTRSGKSTALKHVLDKYFKNHLGCLFSNSIHAHAYKDMNYPLLAMS